MGRAKGRWWRIETCVERRDTQGVVVKLGRIIAMLKSNLTSFACRLHQCSAAAVLSSSYPNEDIRI